MRQFKRLFKRLMLSQFFLITTFSIYFESGTYSIE